jgi:hypothetical protein
LEGWKDKKNRKMGGWEVLKIKLFREREVYRMTFDAAMKIMDLKSDEFCF